MNILRTYKQTKRSAVRNNDIKRRYSSRLIFYFIYLFIYLLFFYFLFVCLLLLFFAFYSCNQYSSVHIFLYFKMFHLYYSEYHRRPVDQNQCRSRLESLRRIISLQYLPLAHMDCGRILVEVISNCLFLHSVLAFNRTVTLASVCVTVTKIFCRICTLHFTQNVKRPLHQPIYAEWILLPPIFGPVHFQYKVCLVSFYYQHVLYKIL